VWRATGSYVPTNSSKAGLLEETRQFLLIYAETQDVEETTRHLKDGALPQRSRETRRTIADFIRRRVARWHPPTWVLDDLVAFAKAAEPEFLQAALLSHVCRQDALLYDLVQQVVVPRWQIGQVEIRSADVQQFLDQAEPTHPEISGWSHVTRKRLASHDLAILRDYGLLQGSAQKRIVEPVIPRAVVAHLVRLLIAEGIPPQELAYHPDWRLWLWEPDQAKQVIDELDAGERAWTS
jgi:hypothetical protein